MLKRTITSVVLLALFIPVLYFSGTVVFPLAISLLSAIAAYEMISCVGLKKNIPIAVTSYALAAILPMLPYLTDAPVQYICVSCMLYMILLFLINVLYRGKLDFTVSASGFTGILYVTVSFACIVMLRNASEYMYLLVFIGPWMSDIFAYIFGRAIGKHKLIPEISPKKTVEGSIAGMIFAALGFVLYAFAVKTFIDKTATPDYVVFALSGIIVSVISQIGDLTASLIKRKFGIKDYGWIFPGHGGVMDRFDSVLLTAPVLYIISQIPMISDMLI